MKKGLISIIVPVYKAEEYLDRCVESLVNQTYTNLEIILVDDGSPDNSGKLCDEWALKDKRIKVIHKENGGVSSARNVGLKAATGEYISFVDSDDYMNESYMECISLFDENIDLITFDYEDDLGNKKSINIKKSIVLKNELLEKIFPWNGSIWNRIYRKSIISKYNLKFDENIKYGEDLIFLINYINKIENKIMYISKNFYHYSYNPNSATNSKNTDLEYFDTVNLAFNKIKNKSNSLINSYILYLIDLFSKEYMSSKYNSINKCLKSVFVYRTFKQNLKIIYLKIKHLMNNCNNKFLKLMFVLKYYILCIRFLFVKKIKFNFMSYDEIINKIIKERKSIARFGDGELCWAYSSVKNSFQKDDSKLAEKLRDILNGCKDNKNDNCIVCMHEALDSMSAFNLNTKEYWKRFYVNNYKDIILKIDPNYKYGYANITRPYMDYKNKDPKLISNKFKNLKKIWNNREIIIVEGQYTKLGIGNNLFDNCKKIERIICPATNAFDKYDEILDCIREQSKDKLILMSLGPTATCLSYDLSKEGYQVIDTGHVDIEYMWFLNGSSVKEAVDGKYVNESKQKLKDKKNSIYDNEIIKKIGV